VPDLDFTIREQWKEQMLYIEGENQFAFECGWGITPPDLYIPDAASWDAKTPSWMHGRRDDIVVRMRLACGDYTIVETT
jgi:hypothetical protein